jgi:hypothetical protein
MTDIEPEYSESEIAIQQIYALEATLAKDEALKTKDEVLKKKDVDNSMFTYILPSTENNHTTC